MCIRDRSSSDQGAGPAVAAALAAWVPSWNPTLRQAPRGRVGNLWSVTTAGAVVFHDGEQWNQAPSIGARRLFKTITQPTAGAGARLGGARKYQKKNNTETIAFFNFLDVLDPDTMQPVLPIYWDDNYVTLLPGEERTYEAKFFLSDFKGEKPVVEVRGWNVEKVTLK